MDTMKMRSALNWHICSWKGATEAKREVLEYRGSVVRLRQRWAQAAPSPGLVDDLELDQLSDARWHQLVCISSQSFKAACTIAHITEEKEEELPPGLRWLLLLGSKTWPNHFRKSSKVATYPWVSREHYWTLDKRKKCLRVVFVVGQVGVWRGV